MKVEDIDLFFEELDRRLGLEAEIIIIGASAGLLMGYIRPSVDIDFEIQVKDSKDPASKEHIQNSIMKTSHKEGIAVNFSDDVSHWSMIDFLDYRRTASRYKKIGKLNIKIIAPEYWTIGKMTRFLELDIQDIMKIISMKHITYDRLIKLWGLAMKKSNLSLELGQFRRHVEFFLKKCGPKLWGKTFVPEDAIKLFHNHAGIRK